MDEYSPNVFSSFPNGISKPLNMINPTYDQMIIKPPDKNKTHGKMSVRVVVDSRTRDKILYPDPSKYLMKLEYEHQDVVSIELTQANIPNTFYNVYEQFDNNGNLLYANNRIYYTESADLTASNIKMKCVKPGKYTTPCDFVSALNNAMASSDSTHPVDESPCEVTPPVIGSPFSYDKITKKIYIKQSNIISSSYHYYFGEKIFCNPKIHEYEYIDREETKTKSTDYRTFGIGELMGFLPNYVYSTAKLQTAHNVLDLNCDRYIILDIGELNRLESNSEPADDTFMVIPVDYEKCTTKLDIGNIPTQREIRYFSAPYPRLDRLTVRFLRYNGDPLFFNGVNHLLDFNVTALNQPGKYNDGHSGTVLD